MTVRRLPLQTMQQIPAFHQLNEGECHQLLEIAQERTFSAGDRILEQGRSSQNMWIVLEGKCEVIKASLQNGPVVLAELEPFNLFGEMSFFSPAPHSADVIAKSSVRLLCIGRKDYDDLIRDGVVGAYKVAYNVVGSVARRLRRMDDWVAELTTHDSESELPEKLPEWQRFRDKMFDGWNL